MKDIKTQPISDLEKDKSVNVIQSEVKESKPSRKSHVLILILVLIIAFLFAGISYLSLTDRVDLSNLSDTTKEEEIDLEEDIINEDTEVEDEEEIEDEMNEEEEKTGMFKVRFSYPSEFIPPIRFCFSNIEDISEQYCFWKKASNDSRVYLNDWETDEGSLPIGSYYVDWTLYNSSAPTEIYSINQCLYDAAKWVSGSVDSIDQMKESCSLVISRLSEEFDEGDQYMADQLANYSTFGGDQIVFEIKENQTTDLGLLGVQPDFPID